jgi:hypothetical protein
MPGVAPTVFRDRHLRCLSLQPVAAQTVWWCLSHNRLQRKIYEQRRVRCEGIACDALLKGRADLRGTAANPGQGST